MKQINLTQGYVAIIDDEDFDLVNQHKWHVSKGRRQFYARTWLQRPKDDPQWPKSIQVSLLMHQLLTGVRDRRVDHIDGDGLNNRRNNLRPATASQNAMNGNRHQDNKSGYKGVCWSKEVRKWHAQICRNGQIIHIGYFLDKEVAAHAYDHKAKELFGEFAKTNFT